METISDDTVRFFGKVTSTATHELVNVLAIIDETSGLMEDIMMINRGSGRDCDQTIIDKIGRVKKQVKRGSEILNALNSFAHAPDSGESVFDACDAVKEVLLLTGRLMKVKDLEITTCGLDRAVAIRTSPALFRLALFKSLELLKGVSPEGGTLKISLLRAGDYVEIIASGDSVSGVSDLELGELSRICGCMNARVDNSDNAIVLRFND